MAKSETPDLDLSISLETLDKSWQTLPDETLVWTKNLSDAKIAQHAAEIALASAKAKAEVHIRQNPSDYGFPKVTEDLVKTLVINTTSVEMATDALAETKAEVITLQAIVDALDVKRSSLKYLSELTLIGYTGTLPSGIKK